MLVDWRTRRVNAEKPLRRQLRSPKRMDVAVVGGEGTTVKMERCECIQGKLRIQKNKSE